MNNNRKIIMVKLEAEDGRILFQKQLSTGLIKQIIGDDRLPDLYSGKCDDELIESLKPIAYLYMDSNYVQYADLCMINNYSGTGVGRFLHV